MVCEYDQEDGTVKVFGTALADAPLDQATGTLKRGWHLKCWTSAQKREGRGGDVVSGRMQAHTPGAYSETGDGTGARVAAELTRMTEIARELGTGTQDWRVKEAYRAELHGGPYPHSHVTRLEDFQLRPHLLYAHGYRWQTEETFAELRGMHDRLHARQALAQTQDSRARDPGHEEPAERDWRDQRVAELPPRMGLPPIGE